MKSRAGESIGIALTCARYGIAEDMARRVKQDRPIVAPMAAFIIADVLDGVIMRQFNLDTRARRIADGIVDHVSVARVADEVYKKNEHSRPYFALLGARAIVVGALNLAHLIETGEATKGRINQKSTNLATALFAVLGNTNDRNATHVGGMIASLTALSTAPSHLKDIGVQHDNGIREL